MRRLGIVLCIVLYGSFSYANQLDNLNLITGQQLPPGTIITSGDAQTLGLDSDAYKFLCTVSDKGCGYSVTGLNPAFAKCLAKMIQAAAAQGHRIRIVSGARTVAEQTVLFNRSDKTGHSVGSPKGSNHVKGMAADLGAGGGMGSFGSSPAGKWTHANAAQYGLYFRMSWEPWHIEPKGTDCNNGQGPGGQQPGDQQGSQAPSPQGGKGPDSNETDPSKSGSPQTPAQQPPAQTQPQSQQPPQMPPPQQPFVKTPEKQSDMTFQCTPESVASGDPVTIEWSCPPGTHSHASGVLLLDTHGKQEGTVVIKPTRSGTYTMQCRKGNVVSLKQSCTISVQAPETKKMKVNFSVTPLEVVTGETVDVTWSSQNARSCAITGGGIHASEKSGRVSSGPLTSDTSFMITCKPKTGTDVYTQSEIVAVIQDTDAAPPVANTQTKTHTTNRTDQTTFSDPLGTEPL